MNPDFIRTNGKLWRLSATAVLVILLVPFLLGEPHARAGSSAALTQLSRQLVTDLNRSMPLMGRAIQVSENNFWERETKINLPFSAALREALAAALAFRGATVTVQEVGREPFKLVGNYGTEGSDLVITLRLRQMGETHSGDLAIARAQVKKNALDATWFEPLFPRIAHTLMRMLEENYSGVNKLHPDIQPLQPGTKGQPTLLLGREFQKYLTNAATNTALFDAPHLGGKGQPVQLAGTYSRINQRMAFHLTVTDTGGRRLTHAAITIALSDIPEDLLKPMGEDVDACVIFMPGKKGSLSADSETAEEMLDTVSEILADHGIKAEACQAGVPHDVQVEVRMTIREKKSSEGYKMASGKLRITVVNRAGKTIGNIAQKGNTFFHGERDTAAAKIAGKILSKQKFQVKLANIIIGR